MNNSLSSWYIKKIRCVPTTEDLRNAKWVEDNSVITGTHYINNDYPTYCLVVSHISRVGSSTLIKAVMKVVDPASIVVHQVIAERVKRSEKEEAVIQAKRSFSYSLKETPIYGALATEDGGFIIKGVYSLATPVMLSFFLFPTDEYIAEYESRLEAIRRHLIDTHGWTRSLVEQTMPALKGMTPTKSFIFCTDIYDWKESDDEKDNRKKMKVEKESSDDVLDDFCVAQILDHRGL